MDSVKLTNFLQTFFHAINDLPLITKIHSSEKHYHEHMLAGKKELEIFTNQDAESILKRTNRNTTLLDTLCWDFVTLAARYQTKEDVPQHKLRVGSLVIFHRGEKPFHKSISRNALGIIIGFAPTSHMDNVVRGV